MVRSGRIKRSIRDFPKSGNCSSKAKFLVKMFVIVLKNSKSYGELRSTGRIPIWKPNYKESKQFGRIIYPPYCYFLNENYENCRHDSLSYFKSDWKHCPSCVSQDTQLQSCRIDIALRNLEIEIRLGTKNGIQVTIKINIVFF